MAENQPKPAKNEEINADKENNAEEGDSSKKPSILKRFQPILIVAAIVIVECIAAAFLAPSGNTAYAEGGPTPTQLSTLREASPVQTEPPEEDETLVEVEMGDYTIIHSTQTQGATIHLTFTLYGLVADGEEGEYELLFKEHENRISDVVREIVRKTEISALAEPGLGLLKREILETVNRRLGKQILRGVGFSDYAFLER